MTREAPDSTGLRYSGAVIGKHTFRLRERHVAEHLAPLLTSKAPGAVKMDLVLRGIALLPHHAGQRRAGLVLPSISYEDLHDLCRPSAIYMTTIPEDEFSDADTLEKKRKWVGEQLQRLEALNLVRREAQPGDRPLLLVLRDDGSREPLDDPNGWKGNSYVTVSGALIASGRLQVWGAPELAAYLAAMVADRFARFRDPSMPIGGATWFQPLDWFANGQGRRPAGHVAIPFSTRTLERGFRSLRESGLIDIRRTRKDPRGGRFKRPRNVYVNQFARLGATIPDGSDEAPESADVTEPV